ncbi:MAG: M48 family peptidase [Dehalococcoidia bacterium]|nr:MAG: M48 family peptidase [Dehalococcoidia bacterium]
MPRIAVPRVTTTEHRTLLCADGVIEYRLVRSSRRRRTIEITIEPDGVRVSTPMRTPNAEIEAAVRERAAWICRHLAAPREAPRVATYEDGEPLTFLGRPTPLLVSERPGRARAALDFFNLRVSVPPRLEAERRQAAVRTAVLAWYRERAAEVIPLRVEGWAKAMGCQPSRIVVKEQKQRWGSCGPDGVLRFNWRLVLGAPVLLDYVVVHELAHLWHPHHGPAFWRAVARTMPDYRERRSRLREWGRTLAI